jgi:glyoxalase-like protein
MSVADRQRPRPGELVVDHVGHYVADLGEAAAIAQKLALKLTPLSVHQVDGKPSGTSNRCLMFEEGYIEILAGAAGRGLRLACFGTPDAEAEQRRLVAHGFDLPAVTNLSRKAGRALVRFKVVRSEQPEGRVQYCEHLTPQHVWKSGFINRMRLTDLYIVADDPAATAARWGRFAGLLPRPAREGVRLQTARGAVIIGRSFPWATPPSPALAGYGLSCRDPRAFLARCRKAGLRVERNTVLLPAALGGAWVFS